MDKDFNFTRSFVEKSLNLMDAILENINASITLHSYLICAETGLEKFIIGGSLSSPMIADVINAISNKDGSICDRVILEARNINVYHGIFSSEAHEMSDMLENIDYT